MTLPTIKALVIETLLFGSGLAALTEGECLEVARSESTFYIYRRGVLAYTISDAETLYRYLILDVPAAKIPERSWDYLSAPTTCVSRYSVTTKSENNLRR
jgi:hypothetical protein